MDEKLILTYNRASLKMIRSNLHIYAIESEDETARQSSHESMMKIDDIIHQIDQLLNNNGA